MNQQESTDFVIRELGKHHQRNEIIQKLCETNGINWKDAERFIQNVEAENANKIAIKQSPLVTIIGIGTIIAGLTTAIGIVVLTMQGYIIFFLSFPIPYLGNIFYFAVGLAMITGGLRGIWDTILRIWNS